MKRLIKKAMTVTLYHGTSMKVLESITASKAIMPNETPGGGIGGSIDREYNETGGKRGDRKRNDFHGFVFLTSDLDIAISYSTGVSAGMEGIPCVVLEVNLSEDALLPDDNDAPQAKTWQESLQQVNEVKIAGPVYEEYIKSVIFFNAFSKLVIFEANLDTWKDKYEENKEKFASDYYEGKRKTKINTNWEKFYKETPKVEEPQDIELTDGVFTQEQLDLLSKNGFNIIADGNRMFIKNGPISMFNELLFPGIKPPRFYGVIDANGDIYYTIAQIYFSEGVKFEYLGMSESLDLLYNKYKDLNSIITNKSNFINNLNNVFSSSSVTITDMDYDVDYNLQDFMVIVKKE